MTTSSRYFPILHDDSILEIENWIYKGEGNANFILAYSGPDPKFHGTILRIKKQTLGEFSLHPVRCKEHNKENPLKLPDHRKLSSRLLSRVPITSKHVHKRCDSTSFNRFEGFSSEYVVERNVNAPSDEPHDNYQYYGYLTHSLPPFMNGSESESKDESCPEALAHPHEHHMTALGGDSVSNSHIYLKLVSQLFGPRFSSPSVLVLVKPGFLEQVNLGFSESRPHNRREQAIDVDQEFCVLTYDHTTRLSPSKPLSQSSSRLVIAIEIKPKWGFIPKSAFVSRSMKTQMCRYCMHLRYKDANGTSSRKTCGGPRFCPLDFFSGDVERTQHSLNALFRHPSNNLRLFCNGMDVPKRKFMKVLANSLGEIENRFSGKQVDETRKVQRAIEHISDILLKERVIQDLGEHQSNLDAFDVEAVFPIYQSLYNVTPENPAYGKTLYASLETWESIIQEYQENTNPSSPLSAACIPESKVERERILFRYLLSMTLKDCSVMMTFQLEPHQESFTYSIKLLDLDPKPISKVPHYFHLDQAIVDYNEQLGEVLQCEV
jgi:inositol-pentakisphosphate 2-kinase